MITTLACSRPLRARSKVQGQPFDPCPRVAWSSDGRRRWPRELPSCMNWHRIESTLSKRSKELSEERVPSVTCPIGNQTSSSDRGGYLLAQVLSQSSGKQQESAENSGSFQRKDIRNREAMPTRVFQGKFCHKRLTKFGSQLDIPCHVMLLQLLPVNSRRGGEA